MNNKFIKVYSINWIRTDNIKVKELYLKKSLVSLFQKNTDNRSIICDFPTKITVMYNGCWEDFYSKLSFEEFTELIVEEENNENEFTSLFYYINLGNGTGQYVEKFARKDSVKAFEENAGCEKNFSKEDYPVFVSFNNKSYYSKLSFKEFKKLIMGGGEKKENINKEPINKEPNKFELLDILEE